MLNESINTQIKGAMKSGDKLRLETLRSIRAAIIEFDKSGVSAAAQAVMGGERGNALGDASMNINQMDTDYRQKMLTQLLGLNAFEAGQEDVGVGRRQAGHQFGVMSRKKGGGGSDYAGYAAGNAAGNAATAFITWLLTPSPEKAVLAGSDINLKENVKVMGLSKEGFPIIEFNYKGGAQRYVGTIAQEVEKLRPEAVVKKDGVRYVDYSKIDVPFKKVA